ncbi:2-hydroxychromene-2-carboxylate isomerase [Pseudoalteromonas sp. DL-6]|uniref:2-hydroxychromene-2-carboxylate isomerase n=1 Tax=Pseudoalteromonas sp. DL-6 TaxID=1390185 RepID=UPI00103E61B4|nr:2-hydroxychromene-2-carboxylate isomerase [Pseudoalteromonas sp. DL-6]QBJ63691.1 hypothetical protein B1F84_11980 [Pseudoalteromonas sp. DL-6]
MKNVDYYFCLNSPWSLFSSVQIRSLLPCYNASLNLKPIDIGRLFDATGGLPLKKRSLNRQKYRLQELERWSRHLEIPINLHPKFYPCNEARADALVMSAEQENGQGLEMAIDIGKMLWRHETDISTPEFIEKQMNSFNLSELMCQKQCSEIMASNTDELIEKGGFGVPTFIVDDEVFWGQDRIIFLIEALK